MTASSLRLRGIHFAYGATPVLRGVDLDVPPGSLFALLGPSGSGKSTMLSILAGLLEPTAGQVILDGDDVTSRPPERRRLGVVFQSYALFPHLSALDNVAFGLRRQGFSREESHRRAHEVVEPLGLAEFVNRRPHELSGGQQQRVALARAIATRPRLLLLDEPLSNIDPALRAQVRLQLREWLARWQITTVLVTHDREDAFWLADRIGLLRDGRLLQQGSPLEVYRRPVDADAAQMLGPINRLPLASSEMPLRLASDPSAATAFALARPEDVAFSAGVADDDAWPARVEQCVHLGAELRALCRLEAGPSVWAGRLAAEPSRGDMGVVRLATVPIIVSAS